MSYFDNIQQIKYEGRTSTNPLAFKFYNPDQVILGKTMREHMRFAIAYWHSFSANGSDPFGSGTAVRAWDQYSGLELAKARVDACFELLNILDVDYFAFHDRDIAPEGNTLQETNQNLDEIVGLIKDKMQATGKNCCGTQQTCSRTRVSCTVLLRRTMLTFCLCCCASEKL